MLTLQDVKWNFLTFKALSMVGIYAYEFDSSTGGIKVDPRWWKQLLFKYVHYPLLLFYTAFYFLRLLQAVVFPKYYVVYQMPTHIINLAWLICVNCWVATVCFILRPHSVAAILDDLYSGGEGCDSRGKLKEKLSKQEWYVKLHPLIHLNLFLSNVYDYWSYPKKLFYLYSLTNDTSAESKLGFLFIDAGFIFIWLSYFSLVDFSLVSFFLHIHGVIRAHMEEINKSRVDYNLIGAARLCRKLQLLIQMFNNTFAYIIFGFKLACLISAITGLYYAIILYHAHRIFAGAIICFVLTLNQILVFVFVFNRAFEIPLLTESLKQTVLVRNVVYKSSRRALDSKVVTRVVRSIPNLGIKVGGFTTFERASTPIFIDFIIHNVVNLLITFNFGMGKI